MVGRCAHHQAREAAARSCIILMEVYLLIQLWHFADCQTHSQKNDYHLWANVIYKYIKMVVMVYCFITSKTVFTSTKMKFTSNYY